MPTHIIIRKRDGTDTDAMPQPRAQAYLTVVLNDKNRVASLKQALNDVYNGGDKATGAYAYDGFVGAPVPVRHASSGDGAQSVSLFFVKQGAQVYLLAMGHHVTREETPHKTVYKLIDYGQPAGQMATDAKISLIKKK
jgi:hypothetical protein